MSSGQMPRRPAYFPGMRYRARARHQRRMLRLRKGEYVLSARDVAKWIVGADGSVWKVTGGPGHEGVALHDWAADA